MAAPVLFRPPLGYVSVMATDDETMRLKLLKAIKLGVTEFSIGSKRFKYASTAEMKATYRELYGPLGDAEAGRSGAGRAFMTSRARTNRHDDRGC